MNNTPHLQKIDIEKFKPELMSFDITGSDTKIQKLAEKINEIIDFINLNEAK